MRWSIFAASAVIATGLSAPPATAAAARSLHSFCQINGCTDGADANGGLVRDADGDLFGTTQSGGNSNEVGVIYELVRNPDRAKWRYRVLYDFCSQASCADSGQTQNGLIIDTAGNLYGTTTYGGATNSGVAFELSPNAGRKRWTFHLLWTFCATSPKCKDGAMPYGNLTYAGASTGAAYDGHSPLFGLASAGGKFNRGIAYALRQVGGGWKEETLYRFCNNSGACPDGDVPYGTPVLDEAGNLYGATKSGGARNVGVLFKLTQISGSKFWNESVLHDFCALPNCADGSFPGGLAIDPSGNIFGTAAGGGDITKCNGAGCGTLFKLASDGTLSVLHTFCANANCSDGSDPVGVTLAASGDIFGATFNGGNDRNAGTVFRQSGSFETLYDFCRNDDCSAGAFPASAPVLDDAGNLYGTGAGGGTANDGAVYKLKP